MLAAYGRPLPPVAALVFRRRHRMHAHPEPLLVLVLELDLPVHHGEQRVVGRAADVRPGMELRAALPDDDRARGDELPGKALHARFPRLYVLAVAREQHAVERHLAPGLRLEQRDLDRDSRLGAKLGATGREDGIAHRARTLIST